MNIKCQRQLAGLGAIFLTGFTALGWLDFAVYKHWWEKSQKTGSRVKWFTQIYADKSRRWARGLWGAVVLGSGACFWALKDWIPGQARDDTAMGSVGDLFRSWVFSYFYARLIRIICVICGCFFQKTGSRLKRFSQIYADKSRRLPRIGIMGVQDLPLDLRAAPLSLSCREY